MVDLLPSPDPLLWQLDSASHGSGQRRWVEMADGLAVLASLQRVLMDVPWEQETH